MKLLFSTLITFALIVNTERPATVEESAASTIAHFVPATEASFGYASPYYLDIDRDGKNDFVFQTVSVSLEGSVHTKYLIQALQNHQVMDVAGSAAISEAGEAISNDMPRGNVRWTESHGEIIESVYNGESLNWNGTWSGDRAQYLGVKLVKEGKSYLGWVRVELNPETEQAFVKEYAINRLPNADIASGQM